MDKVEFRGYCSTALYIVESNYLLDLLHKYLKCHVERSETSREILRLRHAKANTALRFVQNDIPNFWTFARGLLFNRIIPPQ